MNMKKTLLLMMMIFGSTALYCQTSKPDVITTAGGYDANATNKLSWTIGEPITETISNTGNKLTQGIQQGFWDITTAVDNTENRIKITLYPNPATDYVNLEKPFQENKVFTYMLYDLYGKCLQNSKITSSITRIDLNTYPVTVYILNVLSPDKKLMKSFKLLKKN
jgi:hypothetical protein